MSDHLPECLNDDDTYGWRRWCICDELRACEQRVRQEVNAPAYLCVACWHRQDGHTCERSERCMCRDCNYVAGLDAAREAVAATFIGWCKDYMNCTDYEHVCGKRREIIAAIDALRLPAKP